MKLSCPPRLDFTSKSTQILLVSLSWVIYIGGLLIFNSSLQHSELLGLAAIPVMTTGWLMGARKGLVTTLCVIALHIILRITLDYRTINSQAFFLQHLIGIIILSLVSVFMGYLRDLSAQKCLEINALQAAERKLSRNCKLLNLINQSATQLFSSTQWEERIDNFITQLVQTSEVEQVNLFEIYTQAPASFLIHLRQLWKKNDKRISFAPKSQTFTPANSGIGFWIPNAQPGKYFNGKTSTLPQADRTFLSSLEEGNFLIFPIYKKNNLWGMIGFETPCGSFMWEQLEIDAVRTLVQALGSTIHHKEIEETLNERAKEIQTLHEVSQQASSTTQLETTLQSILKQILTIYPIQEAKIYLYTNHKLTLGASLQSPKQHHPSPHHSTDSELAYSAARKNETLIISKIKDYPLFKDIQEHQAGSSVSLPLSISNKVIGVMNIWYPTIRSFSKEEIRILQLFGDQATTAIQNTQFFKIEHEQRKLAEALRKANLQLTSNLELSSVLESILEQTLNLISAQDAHIFLYDGKILELGAVKWRNSQKNTPMSTPREDGLSYNVARSGKQILVSDIRRHKLFKDAPPEWGGAIIGLPLIFSGEVIGIMNIAFAEPRSFTEKTLRILDLLSDQAVLAINNARLFEKEREHRKMAEALQTTGQIVKSSLELNTVLDLILTQLENVVPYDTANLALIRHGKARVVRIQGYKKFKPELLPELKDLSLNVQDFPTLQEMINSQLPLIISDTGSDPRWVATKPTSYVLSWAGAPLHGRDGVIGFLFLNKSEKLFYKSEHKKWISMFASQAALAIENARLFESSQQNARKLKSLHQATSTLVTTLELGELLENILTAAIEAIPAAEKGSLMLKDPHAQQLKVHAIKGYDDPRVKDFSLSIHNGYAALAFREKTPKLFNDIQNDASIHYKNELSEITSIQSAISAPLISQEENPLGVISLDSQKSDAFTTSDLEVLSSFAATATSAIINAQLHAEVQELAITDALTQILNRRGLFQWGEYELERSKRFKRPLSAIFLDLDHFKKVNDTHDHDVGDQVLAKIAERCQQTIRQVDILGRYGGEEFVIILPEINQAKAYTLAERLRKAIASSPFLIDSLEIKMTISLGVAEIDAQIQTLADLIKTADHAMFQSKENGRNQTTQYQRNSL